ncbi:unnamed protein product [Laminaria digitata]
MASCQALSLSFKKGLAGALTTCCTLWDVSRKLNSQTCGNKIQPAWNHVCRNLILS